MKRLFLFVCAGAIIIAASSAGAAAPTGDTKEAKMQMKKFVPVTIALPARLKKLVTAEEKAVLNELIAAARYMNPILLRQIWARNVDLYERLQKAKGKDRALLDYFTLNFGPFDQLDENKPFIDGVGPRPKGANFYPEAMSKEAFERWVKKHPKDRDAFESEYSIIRYGTDGKSLESIPFTEAYKAFLEPAAAHLDRASDLATNAKLKKYLKSRAQAFRTNYYVPSQTDWLGLDHEGIDVVIGPIETYEDELFGYKASYQSYVLYVDPEESARLAKITSAENLKAMQQQLPVPEKYRGKEKKLKSQLVIAHLLYATGDGNSGIKTMAFNLPNQEFLRKTAGSKNVMMKNVMTAKFDKILTPIAKRVLNAADAKDIDPDAFFSHTVMHEVSHGLGPGEIVVHGRKTDVRRQLKEVYSFIEECKADTLGAYLRSYLAKIGIYPENFERVLWPTYLASIFRSVRFGVHGAHGKANIIQFNYLFDKGAIIYDAKTKTFGIDRDRITDAARDLAGELLAIEATGDYKAAKAFVERYEEIRPEMKVVLEKLEGIPVDLIQKFAYSWKLNAE